LVVQVVSRVETIKKEPSAEWPSLQWR